MTRLSAVRRQSIAPLLGCLLLLPFSIRPGGLSAQTEIEARSSSLTVGGRLQAQYQSSSVEAAAGDLFLRRARVRLDADLEDFLDGRIGIDVAGGGASLKDAWVRMTFNQAFRVSVGQFKRAFSVFDLSSSTDLPIIERDGRIAGLAACPGVGGVCSMSRLTEQLGFEGRDRGVRIEGSPGGGLAYRATLTNGEGANERDVNDAKSVSGRVEYQTGRVVTGVFGGIHDHLNEVGGGEDTDYARAGGIDVELGTWRDGFHLLAAVTAGDHWAVGPEAGFLAFHGLASYYVDLGRPRLAGVEPMLRVSWADPDRDGADDAGTLLTPGFMAYMKGKNGIAANLDIYTPQGEGDTELSLKIQTFLYF